MKRILRIGIAAVALASVLAEPAQSLDTAVAPVAGHPEEERLVAWALSRFDEAGLALPDLSFSFHPSPLDCAGHKGRYHLPTQTVHMCSLDPWTMLHELAHAWADATLTDADRAAFVAHRGLRTWGEHHHPWAERATEHAAEIVAWALSEESALVPWVMEGPDGPRSTLRLLRISDSEPEQLVEAYRLLTGSEPPFREAAEWETSTEEVSSPEAVRAGG